MLMNRIRPRFLSSSFLLVRNSPRILRRETVISSATFLKIDSSTSASCLDCLLSVSFSSVARRTGRTMTGEDVQRASPPSASARESSNEAPGSPQVDGGVGATPPSKDVQRASPPSVSARESSNEAPGSPQVGGGVGATPPSTPPSLAAADAAPPVSPREDRNGADGSSPAATPPSVADDDSESGDDVGDRRRRDGEWFLVSDSVKLALHRGDITRWYVDGETDAIVNAANERMLGGGGVDGAIHSRAGPQLKEACRQFPQVSPGVRCPTGEARVTKGFNLPVSRVIHTVGPVYYDHDYPAELLGDAYRNSLKAAVADGIKYVAFPAISCGVYGYPIDEAAAVSLSAIKEASEGLSEVHFVLFDKKNYAEWLEEAEEQFEKI